GQPRAARRAVRGDDRRLALRDGRTHAAAGAQLRRALPRGLSTRPGALPDGGNAMTMIKEPDLGTPPADRGRQPAAPTVRVTIDGHEIAVAPGTSVMRAAALAGV